MKIRIMSAVMYFTLVVLIVSQPVKAEEFQPMHPDSVGCGELLWHSSQGLIPLPLISTDISIDVTGPLVKGSIRQKFTNPTSETIEAVYVFPMPDGAAVDAMELLVGERRIISIVLEKAQARKTYAKAKAEGKKAALVERMRANLFNMSVAGIEPGQTVTVKLQYLDQVEFSGGSFKLAFPLTFTPRYFPPALLHDYSSDAATLSSTFLSTGHPMVPKATISVNLNTGLPLKTVSSTSHTINRKNTGQQSFISTSEETIAADRDFLLSWTPEQGADPLTALFTETRADGRYALLMVVPGNGPIGTMPKIPTETLFLIDVSGSMDGPSIRQARQSLQQAVDRLGPADTFNLMAFNNDSRIWHQTFQPATVDNLNKAHSWIRSLKAEGGTGMHGALLRAMTQFLHREAGSSPISRRIILMTDAAIGNESQLLRDTANKLGDVRLHVVGIGSSPNRYLVNRLASQGGGLAAFVHEHAGAGEGMDKFLATISRPLITNTHLTWNDSQPDQTSPSRIPELYAGELFLWSGKFPSDGKIQGILSADFADDELNISLVPNGSAENQNSVAVRWAQMKVADLMSRLNMRENRDQVRKEIVETGIEFGLVTRFTSRLAVEEIATTNAVLDPHHLANGLPHGTIPAGVLPRGGTLEPLLKIAGWFALMMGLLLASIQMHSTIGGKS